VGDVGLVGGAAGGEGEALDFGDPVAVGAAVGVPVGVAAGGGLAEQFGLTGTAVDVAGGGAGDDTGAVPGVLGGGDALPGQRRRLPSRPVDRAPAIQVDRPHRGSAFELAESGPLAHVQARFLPDVVAAMDELHLDSRRPSCLTDRENLVKPAGSYGVG